MKKLFALCIAILTLSCAKDNGNMLQQEIPTNEAQHSLLGENPLTLDCFNGDVDPIQVCPDVIDPVCACGVITFQNRCSAESMGFTNTTRGRCIQDACRSVAVKQFFEDLGTPCSEIYQPVCGCDGKTYGNPCQAVHSGVLAYVPGECPPVVDKVHDNIPPRLK